MLISKGVGMFSRMEINIFFVRMRSTDPISLSRVPEKLSDIVISFRKGEAAGSRERMRAGASSWGVYKSEACRYRDVY